MPKAILRSSRNQASTRQDDLLLLLLLWSFVSTGQKGQKRRTKEETYFKIKLDA